MGGRDHWPCVALPMTVSACALTNPCLHVTQVPHSRGKSLLHLDRALMPWQPLLPFLPPQGKENLKLALSLTDPVKGGFTHLASLSKKSLCLCSLDPSTW